MESHDVFLASPLSGWTERAEIAAGRELAHSLATALRGLGLTVFFAGESCGENEEPLPPDFAQNAGLVKRCATFVLVTADQEVSRSSIWVEAGIALGRDIPSIFIAPGPTSLPILIQQAVVPTPGGGQPDAHGLWFDPRQGAAGIVENLLPALLVLLETPSRVAPGDSS
jgi:hypothetical protein